MKESFITTKLENILKEYGIVEEVTAFRHLQSGLINQTSKIEAGGEQFILQKINHSVFNEPAKIAHNIRVIGNYLAVHHPNYTFVAPVRTSKGADTITLEGGEYYRLFPFVTGSHTLNKVTTPMQAFEAASQFGAFTALLSGFDTSQLQITIPYFHDLTFRYRQFAEAVSTANPVRKTIAEKLIATMQDHFDLVVQFENIKKDPAFRKRVTHHDTKISNVLFNDSDRAICVIDLDTVMPGYFISDVGDMMRTYLSSATEEETDLSKIIVREEIFKAIIDGYSLEMKDELTPAESRSFVYAAKFIIYMQALRFLTDYLNNDRYYAPAYPDHNFNRAMNQSVLLKQIFEKEETLSSYQSIR
ncbi:aminoglycoside phosphotransferase family protein [Terrimonas sp. NA20]|uniref:Aminoglycoside phosphotransferase family protein n=1 Tax=Terrimonas ginsenosidimutans TaxID=2908004 RepID=A0ABS9KT06_9BACT|nr:aminoglycoside phosphotransferase family protein [Terrimonas ginsenosidimutans]MCG2615466.1 aminoglycoside phosphotransferase family protein [Terrimonas ginsenosidimutans]